MNLKNLRREIESNPFILMGLLLIVLGVLSLNWKIVWVGALMVMLILLLLGVRAMERGQNNLLKWIRDNFMVSTGLLMLGFGALGWDKDLVGLGIFMVIFGVLFDEGGENT